MKTGEQTFRAIDRFGQAIAKALDQSPIYKKQGQVNAQPAIAGQLVVTIIGDGKETQNVAKPGDWVVTNPSGEQYLVSNEKFQDRYEAAEKPSVYNAKGYCRAIVNPFDFPIKIMASWGEPQTGGIDCMIVDTCDVEGRRDNEPYLIDGAVFAKTYRQIVA